MFTCIVSKKACLLFLFLTLSILSLPTSSQTDNCCSIDRQCNTDEQWIRGWWAFRNNQCAALSAAASASGIR